jgi:hypothetical protein
MLVRAKPDPLPASPLAGRSAKSAELSAEQASTKRQGLTSLRPTFFPVFVLKIKKKSWPQGLITAYKWLLIVGHFIKIQILINFAAIGI